MKSKKIRFFSAMIFLTSILPVLAQDAPAPPTETITVEISGFRNNTGKALISLYSAKKGFPDTPEKAFQSATLSINKNSAKHVFRNIPHGKYALSVLHDEDQNKKLKTNFWGIPKEGVGVSNNIFPKKGKPKFSDAQFVLNDKTPSIKIIIHYY